jgi:hypothetical protein
LIVAWSLQLAEDYPRNPDVKSIGVDSFDSILKTSAPRVVREGCKKGLSGRLSAIVLVNIVDPKQWTCLVSNEHRLPPSLVAFRQA